MQRRRVVDADGGPLGAALAGAHVHATQRLAATLEASVVVRPQPTEAAPPPLGRDQGDDHPTGHEPGAACRSVPHSRRMGEDTREARGPKTSPAQRWVGERTLAWLSTCRGLLVRDETNAINCFGVRQRACALLWMRRRAPLMRD